MEHYELPPKKDIRVFILETYFKDGTWRISNGVFFKDNGDGTWRLVPHNLVQHHISDFLRRIYRVRSGERLYKYSTNMNSVSTFNYVKQFSWTEPREPIVVILQDNDYVRPHRN